MSRALYAQIAILLAQAPAEWVRIEVLAGRLALSVQAVRSACELMRASGLLAARLADGMEHIEAVRTPEVDDADQALAA